MCPNNTIGAVDLLLGLHHGMSSSNSEALVHALRPRVAIMNNGTRKGGEPEMMKTVYSSPGLEDLWQMHFSLLSGQEYTVPGHVHRQYGRRPATQHAHRSDGNSCARSRRTSCTPAHGDSVLDQGVGTTGRKLHGHQLAERLQQVLWK